MTILQKSPKLELSHEEHVVKRLITAQAAVEGVNSSQF